MFVISTVRCSILHPTRKSNPIQPPTYSTTVLHPSLTCYLCVMYLEYISYRCQTQDHDFNYNLCSLLFSACFNFVQFYICYVPRIHQLLMPNPGRGFFLSFLLTSNVGSKFIFKAYLLFVLTTLVYTFFLCANCSVLFFFLFVLTTGQHCWEQMGSVGLIPLSLFFVVGSSFLYVLTTVVCNVFLFLS